MKKILILLFALISFGAAAQLPAVGYMDSLFVVDANGNHSKVTNLGDSATTASQATWLDGLIPESSWSTTGIMEASLKYATNPFKGTSVNMTSSDSRASGSNMWCSCLNVAYGSTIDTMGVQVKTVPSGTGAVYVGLYEFDPSDGSVTKVAESGNMDTEFLSASSNEIVWCPMTTGYEIDDSKIYFGAVVSTLNGTDLSLAISNVPKGDIFNLGHNFSLAFYVSSQTTLPATITLSSVTLYDDQIEYYLK